MTLVSGKPEVPQLFSAVKAIRALERAERGGFEHFLLDRLAEDLIDRLSPVLRDFDQVVDLGTPGAAFARALRSAGRGKSFRHMSPLPTASTDFERQPLELGALQLEPASAALIASGMLLHRVNDVPGVLIQARQALRPDGLFLAAFPGGDSLFELRDALLTAESELTGRASLRVFPMVDVRAAGQLLQRAGFALPVTDSEKITIRYRDLMAIIRDLRAMGQSAALLNRGTVPPLTLPLLMRASELYAERHADPDGRLRVTVEIIWMSGWAPHESQQKPLKPGSAKAKLADALAAMAEKGAKTVENP